MPEGISGTLSGLAAAYFNPLLTRQALLLCSNRGRNLKFESKIAVLGGFKPRTAIFLYVLYRPSFKFVKNFFIPFRTLKAFLFHFLSSIFYPVQV